MSLAEHFKVEFKDLENDILELLAEILVVVLVPLLLLLVDPPLVHPFPDGNRPLLGVDLLHYELGVGLKALRPVNNGFNRLITQ